MSSRNANNPTLLGKNEHRLLSLMLSSLIASMTLNTSDTITQSILLVHFGLFLLWQPVINTSAKFEFSQIVILLGIVTGFILFSNPWLTTAWALVLLSLLSGRIFARGMARAAYGIAVSTLLLSLVLISTPDLFNLVALESSTQDIVSYFLIGLPLIVFFIPVTDSSSSQLDYLRGIAMVVLVTFMCMSSALITLSSQLAYLESVISSLLIISLFMLLSSYLWSPRGGFSGLAKLWEKYLLNIGGPFEDWITHVSILETNATLRPKNFVSASLRYLMNQDWISGVKWKLANDEGIHGKESQFKVGLRDDQLEVELYSHTPIGPTLMLHCRLLLSVLSFYYRARLQEQQLIHQAHMQAIYETGSKLTHDVKNILQSTQTMAQIIDDKDSSQDEIMEVLKRQMPLLTQRLNITLDKLKSPVKPSGIQNTHKSSLLRWWNQLQHRYTGRHIHFKDNIQLDVDVITDVFNTVSENLLDNARSKRMREPKLCITVDLSYINAELQLRVTDTGTAIEKDVIENLLSEVVPSEDGFGIGLYQCGQLARDHGYNLVVDKNIDGEVSFLLSRTYTE